MLIAAIFTIGGKFLFSLPFLFVILSGLKIKGFTALQMVQLWRLIQFLKNSGRFSQGQFNQRLNTYFKDVTGQVVPTMILGRKVPRTQSSIPDRYYPRAYYKSIDMCVQVVQKLSPVQKDTVENYQNFRIKLTAVSPERMRDALENLANAIDLRLPEPRQTTVEEYAGAVRGMIGPYF